MIDNKPTKLSDSAAKAINYYKYVAIPERQLLAGIYIQAAGNKNVTLLNEQNKPSRSRYTISYRPQGRSN